MFFGSATLFVGCCWADDDSIRLVCIDQMLGECNNDFQSVHIKIDVDFYM